MPHDCYHGLLKEPIPKLDLDPLIRIKPGRDPFAQFHTRADYESGYRCPECPFGSMSDDERDFVRSSRATMRTLRNVLTELQFSNYYHAGMFAMIDANDDVVVIRAGMVGNVHRRAYTFSGSYRWVSYCCHSLDCSTYMQNNLEQFLALSTKEHVDRFWVTGNICDHRDDYVA